MKNIKCCVEAVFILCWLFVGVSHGKSIGRCDFVHELKRIRPQIDYQTLNAWTCLAQYQSNFNTDLLNSDASGAGYHGIFQISDVFWCSSNAYNERACKIRCDQLHDTFLNDDFDCAETIYAEHLKLFGNGFNAWNIYGTHCSDGRDVIADCVSNTNNKAQTRSGRQFGDKAITEQKTHKVYERCELARELHYVHNILYEQIATWVCIAKYESNYNTSALGIVNEDGNRGHGLFVINDLYWCSPPGEGRGCGLSCASLEDADITDDVACTMKIYEEHQRLSGNGFNSWTAYKRHCKHNVNQFIAGCFENVGANDINLPVQKTAIFAPPPNIRKSSVPKKKGKGKIFDRCELAKELRYKHNLPKDQIHTWICIAKTLSDFNTAAEAPKNADGSSSHGLFQINDQFWCDVNGNGKGCQLNCNALKDDDITDDIACVQKIFDEHSQKFGNGFHAWTPYEHHCKDERPESLQDCFDNEIIRQSDFPLKPTTTKKPTYLTKSGKIYERCELAKELRNVHNVLLDQIHTWVCIANHESRFDTSAIGRLNADGSLDHGLFQISDIYWCSNSGVGKACNAACSDFRNADISDDVRCVQQIHNEHQRLFGNGFHAWTVYEPHCRHVTNQYISDCFPNDIYSSNIVYTTPKPVISVVSNAVDDQGRSYERCELAKELRYRHNVPQHQISDWVCIALYSSNLATSAKGPNSHGLFQINDEYWCSNNGVPGKECHVECSKFEDSDITDDMQCARSIYDVHQRLYGNGFSAWNVHEPYCRGKSSQLIVGCFDDIEIGAILKPTPSPSYTLNVNYESNQINNFNRHGKKGKIYERCELARELRYKYNLPFEHIHTWICIVQRESNFDTSIIGRLNADGSLDHGLFQISDIYWCSNSGVGKACNAACTDFEDADISDDVRCVTKIFDEHQRLYGNGFHAWTTYEPYCKQTTSTYTDDCFVNAPQQKVETITKRILPAYVPFTTTPKPSTVAATLTPLNSIKNSTFKPFSLLAPTPFTTKYPTATAQFVSYYTTSTTKKPSFSTTTLQTTKKPITFTTRSAFAPTYTKLQSTTPRSFVSIGIKTVKNHTYAVIQNSASTPTPKKTTFQTNNLFAPTSQPPNKSTSSKFNIYDLYLGRATTKQPERYVIPTFAPILRQSVTPSIQYTTPSTRYTPFLNTYSIPNYLKTKSTTDKLSPQQVQTLFQRQVASISQTAGIQNSTYFTTNSVNPTPRKSNIFRYSFSGTKAP